MDKIKIAGITVFCVMLFGFSAASFLLPQKEYSDRENRMLEQRPKVSVEDIQSGDYQERYEKYLTDQIFLRDRWMQLAVTMERLAGRREINGVYIGKDGYLLEKYSASDFEPARIDENIGILSDFLNTALRKYGKQHVSCMLLPAKANAMPAKLPVYADTYEEKGTITGLGTRLKEPDMLLDAGNILREHQDEYIYYRTDHHWTTLGAYYAYCAWAEQTGHTPRPLEDYRRETAFTDFYGTTYNKVQLNVPMDSVELFHGPGEEGVSISEDDGEVRSDSFYFPKEASEGFDRYRVFLSKNTAKIEIQTKAGTGKGLLLIKDSFANCFVPFLAEYYDKIIMIDCRYSKENVRAFMEAHDELTDVLVMYNTEKFMQDTNLRILEEKSDTVEEFDLEDFMKDAS